MSSAFSVERDSYMALFNYKELETLQAENDVLKEKISVFNERGARRKHRATPEQREHIISLSYQGVSQNKIADIMTNQTGEKWNKTPYEIS